MGTDIHGPWIETKTGLVSEGRGSWSCIAKLGYPVFQRDYLLFDILNGMRHGNQTYTVQTETRGLPEDISEEWFRHAWTWDEIHQVWLHPEDYDGHRKYSLVKWGNEFDGGSWGHFGFTWMTLDEVKLAQERYVEVGDELRCSPQGRDEAKMLAEKEAARERGENVGMIAIKGLSIIPQRHKGLDLAIEIMKWVEDEIDAEVRMSMCYDN